MAFILLAPNVPDTSEMFDCRPVIQEENHARAELECRKQEQRLRERNRRQRELAEERRLRELKKKVSKYFSNFVNSILSPRCTVVFVNSK